MNRDEEDNIKELLSLSDRKAFYRPRLLNYLRKMTYAKKTFTIEFVGGAVIEIKKDLNAYPVRKVRKRRK